jgi:thiamine-phosphate pyrophosphorylase
MLERLMIVTDRRLGDVVGLVERALAGVRPGTVLVQLREKDLGGRALHELALRVRDVTRRAGARLVINDRVDVALAVGADGVHLPEAGLDVEDVRRIAPGLLVGASVHDAEGARRRSGADYLVAGAVWEVPGKPAIGLDGLRAIIEAAASPVIAIGGIDLARADQALAAGAHGVAAIRAVLAARDPASQAAALVDVGLNR